MYELFAKISQDSGQSIQSIVLLMGISNIRIF